MHHYRPAAGQLDPLRRDLFQQPAGGRRQLLFHGADHRSTRRRSKFGKTLEPDRQGAQRRFGIGKRHRAMLRGESRAAQKCLHNFDIVEARQPGFHGFRGQQRGGGFRVGRAAALFDRDLVEPQRAHALHALGGAIPFHARGLADTLREQIQQPAGLDAAGDAHQRGLLIAAIFGFHGHQELGRGHRARRRQLRRSTGRKLQFGILTAPRHAVGERRQHRHQERLFVMPALPRRVDHAPHLPHRLRRARLPRRLHQHQQIGVRGLLLARRQTLAGTQQGGHRAAILGHAATPRFHHQAR